MLSSMTAFGRGSTSSANGEIVCEIRSVNHRYLDTSVRLPEALRAAEAGIRERLSQTLHRGKVDVVLKISDGSDAVGSLAINDNLLAELTAAAGRVGSMTEVSCVIDAVRLLEWPGVVGFSSESLERRVQEALLAFDDALDDFVASREREGLQLSGLLRQRNEQLIDLVSRLREHRPTVLARQREKLQARIAELDIEHDGSRLEQELVYAAQRLDIDEELDRLTAHCAELSQVLERKDAVGRRLDFLMQEFNRETNTIGSKSADQRTTAIVVDMKVLIEQMREQIQNIE